MAAVQVDNIKDLVEYTKRSTKQNPTTGDLYQQLPCYTPKPVILYAKIFPLFDAAFKRSYLIEPRPVECEDAKYELGDLVWVKMKNWPWWPAMVSVHPQRDVYLKYHSENNKDASYHVQYFGAQPYHGWISSHNVKPFTGFEEFHREMIAQLEACATPTSRKHKLKSFAVTYEQMTSLNQAIAEAEAAAALHREKRIRLLTFRYYSIRYSRFYD